MNCDLIKVEKKNCIVILKNQFAVSFNLNYQSIEEKNIYLVLNRKNIILINWKSQKFFFN